MRWFLYDETARERIAAEYGVPLDTIHRVRGLLESVSPYMSTIRYALDEVGDNTRPVIVELEYLLAGGELVTIVNT